MRICIPGQMVHVPQPVYVGSTRYEVGIPINGRYDYVDSLFWDEDGQQENDCCHAAYLTSHTSDGKGFREVNVIAGGYSFCNQGRCSRHSAGRDDAYVATWPVGEEGTGGLLLISSFTVSLARKAFPIVHWDVQTSTATVFAYGTKDGRLDAQGRGRKSSKMFLQAKLYGVDYSKNPSLQGTIVKEGGDLPIPNGTILGSFQLQNWSDPKAAYHAAGDLAEQWAHLCAQAAQQWAANTVGSISTTYGVQQALLPRSLTASDFLLDEWSRLVTGYPVATSPNKGYCLQWLKQHAYLDAIQSAPTLSDNSLSNILEMVDLIHGLVNGKVEIPKRWQDAWLAYRYQYMTTKLDIQEAIKFFKRMSNLSSLNASIKSYGSATYTVDDTEVRCNCRCTIKPSPNSSFDKLWGWLSRLGLAPDSYVIWDMTPFSFMVDWLVPVGDILDVFDTSALLGSYWDISDVCFSLQYHRDLDGYPAKFYTRWITSSPPELQEFYWFDRPGASQKVRIFRLLDVASLFIGGK